MTQHYFGAVILQYVNGGIGNDGKARKKTSNLATKRSRVKYTYGSVSDKGIALQYPGAKYHVLNLSTSYEFILILCYVSILSITRTISSECSLG